MLRKLPSAPALTATPVERSMQPPTEPLFVDPVVVLPVVPFVDTSVETSAEASSDMDSLADASTSSPIVACASLPPSTVMPNCTYREGQLADNKLQQCTWDTHTGDDVRFECGLGGTGGVGGEFQV